MIFNWFKRKRVMVGEKSLNTEASQGTPTSFGDLSEVVAFDFETTGLDPKKDRVVSICMLKGNLSDYLQDSEFELGVLDTKINPEIDIPGEATLIHGITNSAVAKEKRFSELAADIVDFVGTLPLIAHNIDFDGKFLDAELIRCKNRKSLKNKRFCTMVETARSVGGNHKRTGRISLQKACSIFNLNLNRTQFHSAFDDALATFKIAALLRQLEIEQREAT